MADSRIPGLPDGAVITDFYFIMDKAGESSAVKVPYSAVGDLITALQSSVQTNADNIQTNTDNISSIQSVIDVLNDEVDWATCQNTSSKHQANSYCEIAKVGKIAYLTGAIQLSSTQSENEVIFTVPSLLNIPNFSHTIPFTATGASPEESYELKAVAGTRQIQAGPGGSTNSTAFFCVPLPLI